VRDQSVLNIQFKSQIFLIDILIYTIFPSVNEFERWYIDSRSFFFIIIIIIISRAGLTSSFLRNTQRGQLEEARYHRS